MGYTQKQVADLLGVDRSTYSYYELGRIKPDINTVMELSKIFGVHYTQILESEVNYRFSDFSDCNSEGKDLIDGLTPEEYHVLMTFKLLPENSKSEIIKLIDEKFKNDRRIKSKEKIEDYFK